MQDQLKVALVQTQLFWEQPKKNRQHIEVLINQLSDEIDIVVLPEMFATGFTMNPEKVAETMQGPSVSWMKKMASKKNSVVCGSLAMKLDTLFVNRFVWVAPSGEIKTYDKRHTFTLAGEHKVYKKGTEKVIIEYKGWKICPQVCYDLRFPVWARNVEDYDLLIYVANWPKPRIHAWDALLKARSIENMSYCIGVNRVGVDENNNEYSGHSIVLDALGTSLATSRENMEETITATLDKDHLKSIRQKLRFLEDRDTFNLQV